MRTRIKVTDLSPAQWAYVDRNIRVEYGQRFGPSACIVFESAPMVERHAEMPLDEFILVMVALHHIDTSAVAEAALSETDGEPSDPPRQVRDARWTPTCEHGAPVSQTEPSAFDGADPIRTYADGCQSFGPYPSGS